MTTFAQDVADCGCEGAGWCVVHGAGDPRDADVESDAAQVAEYEARYELTGLEEHERDTFGCPDYRVCPNHPGVRTSSDDGMFDGVCGICEGEMHDAAERWEYDPENPSRAHCGTGPVRTGSWELFARRGTVECVPDEIPF